jgi:hypothetical protein
MYSGREATPDDVEALKAALIVARCRGTGGKQSISKGPQLDGEKSTRGLVGSGKGHHHDRMSAVYRRSVEAEILADNPPHSVQLSDRYPRQMAWKPLSVRPALSIRSARGLGRRIRRSVHSPRLDKPRPLRYPMASTHGNLVLPLSWPVACRGIEDYRKRRTFTPTIASRPSS